MKVYNHIAEKFINKRTEFLSTMEFNVLEESKNKLVFQLKGETHTFCNLLKEELYLIKSVKIATYKIDHPLIGLPTFMVETEGIEPRKAIKDALKNLRKKAEDFKKEVKSL